MVEQRAGGQRDLALAADALPDLALAQLAALVVAAVGAAEALGPARLNHGLLAQFDGSVESEEFWQALAFLERQGPTDGVGWELPGGSIR